MTSFGGILSMEFFGCIAVGLAIFVVAVRARYRVWLIWLAGLAAILVFVAWPESSSMGIPWGRVVGEGVAGQQAGGIGLGVFFVVSWTAAGLFGWSLAALIANVFKSSTPSSPSPISR
jgi:hypothetical protein